MVPIENLRKSENPERLAGRFHKYREASDKESFSLLNNHSTFGLGRIKMTFWQQIPTLTVPFSAITNGMCLWFLIKKTPKLLKSVKRILALANLQNIFWMIIAYIGHWKSEEDGNILGCTLYRASIFNAVSGSVILVSLFSGVRYYIAFKAADHRIINDEFLRKKTYIFAFLLLAYQSSFVAYGILYNESILPTIVICVSSASKCQACSLILWSVVVSGGLINLWFDILMIKFLRKRNRQISPDANINVSGAKDHEIKTLLRSITFVCAQIVFVAASIGVINILQATNDGYRDYIRLFCLVIYCPLHVPITIAAAVKLHNDEATKVKPIPEELQYYDESTEEDSPSKENDHDLNLQELSYDNDSIVTIHI